MKILNQAQAEAIYGAICAANNISGRVKVKFDQRGDHDYTLAYEGDYGGITVRVIRNRLVKTREDFKTQADFATNYGLA